MIFHSLASDTSSNMDTQVDTMPFSISDVQQPPFTGDPLEQTEPGSSFNFETSPEEFLADESEACLDPNQNNPHSRARSKRGSTPPEYCPSQIVPEAGRIEDSKKPEASRNSDGTRKLPEKKPQGFDPLNMPTFEDGETLKNPCKRHTVAKTPVCDSGYFGPTLNLAECRLCTFIDFYFLSIIIYSIFLVFFDFVVLRTMIIYKYIFTIFTLRPRDSLYGVYSQCREPLVLCPCEERGEFLIIFFSRAKSARPSNSTLKRERTPREDDYLST